eukprot:5127099-Pyramimonas_sp.AAC.1
MLEQWASRPTYLGIASYVELTGPRAVAVDSNETGRVRCPGRPWGPVAGTLIVLQVADVDELVAVLRDVHPALAVVAPISWAPLAALKVLAPPRRVISGYTRPLGTRGRRRSATPIAGVG